MRLNNNADLPEDDGRVTRFELRLSSMENLLSEIHDLLSRRQATKDWYTVREVAEILERSEFTVREWCRLGRVFASKRACGRGNSKEWIISDEELRRIQNEGLLSL